MQEALQVDGTFHSLRLLWLAASSKDDIGLVSVSLRSEIPH